MLILITNTLTARANQCWRACVKSVCCARLLSQVPCNRKWWFEGKCLCFENNFKCVCVLKGESEVFWRGQLDWPMFKNSTFSVTQKIPHYINQKGFFIWMKNKQNVGITFSWFLNDSWRAFVAWLIKCLHLVRSFTKCFQLVRLNVCGGMDELLTTGTWTNSKQLHMHSNLQMCIIVYMCNCIYHLWK